MFDIETLKSHTYDLTSDNVHSIRYEQENVDYICDTQLDFTLTHSKIPK